MAPEGRRRAVERRPRRSRPARRGRPGTPEAASSEQQQQQQQLLLPLVLLLPSKAAAAAQRPAPGGAGEVVRYFWSGESGVRGGASRESESCRRFLLLSPQFNPDVPVPSASARLLLLLPCARCPADERRRQEEEEAPLLLLLRCHRAFSEAIDFCFFLIFHSSEKLEDWGVQRVSSRSSTRSLARARARASPVPTSSEVCTYQPGARCNKKAGERERERDGFR